MLFSLVDSEDAIHAGKGTSISKWRFGVFVVAVLYCTVLFCCCFGGLGWGCFFVFVFLFCFFLEGVLLLMMMSWISLPNV